MLRAIRAEMSVGRPSASSNEFVWRHWVPPSTAAMASYAVRTMLLYGSCSVSETPDVWQCVRSIDEAGFCGSNWRMRRDQSSRAAQLGDLHEEVHPDGEEERQPRRERVDVEAPGVRRPDVLEPVGEREAELLHGGRPGLLHVVAGDGDGVEPGHVLLRCTR